MNKVYLIGRTTKDIELAYTNTQKAFVRFTIAINRRGENAGADFIECTAWNKTAELLSKYVHIGNRVAVAGRIQTGSYTNKEGRKIYTTTVVVDEVEFLEKAKNESSEHTEPNNGFASTSNNPFEDKVEDEGLPFNIPF